MTLTATTERSIDVNAGSREVSEIISKERCQAETRSANAIGLSSRRDILTGQDIADAARYRLTDRQAAILAFIKEYGRTRGYPPTLREIGARFGIRSTNGVNDHLRALERKGAISRADMKSRGISVLNASPVVVEKIVSAEVLESREKIQRLTAEAQGLRALLRRLYTAAKERDGWKLDAVASAISADFALHGEKL